MDLVRSVSSLLLIPFLLGATYYVDPTGTDDADCDTAVACGATACATFDGITNEGGATLASSDIINMCSGIHSGTDVCIIISTDGITVQGSTGTAADVTIRTTGTPASPCNSGSGDAHGVVEISADNITIKDMTIEPGVDTAGGNRHNGVTVNRGTDTILLQNLLIQESTHATLTNACRTGIKVGPLSAPPMHGEIGATVTPADVIQNLEVDNVTVNAEGCNFKAGWFSGAPRAYVHDSEFYGCHSGVDTPTGDCDNTYFVNSDAFRFHDNIVRDLPSGGEQCVDLSRTGDGDGDCQSFNAGMCSSSEKYCLDDTDCDGGGDVCDPWEIVGNTIFDCVKPIVLKQCAQQGLIQNNFINSIGSGDVYGGITYESCGGANVIVDSNTFLMENDSSTIGPVRCGAAFTNNIVLKPSGTAGTGQLVRVGDNALECGASSLPAVTWDNNILTNEDSTDAVRVGVVGGPNETVDQFCSVATNKSCVDANDCPATETCGDNNPTLGARICPTTSGAVADTDFSETELTGVDGFQEEMSNASPTGLCTTACFGAGTAASDQWDNVAITLVDSTCSGQATCDLHLGASETDPLDNADCSLSWSPSLDFDRQIRGDPCDIGADEVNIEATLQGVTIDGVTISYYIPPSRLHLLMLAPAYLEILP